MAFLPQSELEKQKENEKNQGGSNTQEQVISGGSGTISGSTGPSAGGAGAGSPRGSSFVGLNEYLNANKSDNNPSGPKVVGADEMMASKVVSGVQGDVDKAKTLGRSAEQDLVGRAKQNTVSYTAPTTGGFTAAQDKGATEQLRNAYNATYKGPSIQDRDTAFADANKQATTAQSQLENLKTRDGYGAALAKQFTRNDRQYTKGENRLDSYILGASDAGKQAIGGLLKSNETFGNDFGRYGQNAADEISRAQQTTDKSRLAAQGELARMADTVSRDFGTAKALATTKQKEFDKKFADDTTKLRNGTVVDGIGQTEMDVARKLGVDPSKFLKKSGSFGAANFLNPETAAALPNLRNLLKELAPGTREDLMSDLSSGAASVTTDTGALDTLRKIGSTSSELDRLAAAKNLERDAGYQSATSAFMPSGFAPLGSTPSTAEQRAAIATQGGADPAVMEYLYQRGIDVQDLITAGTKVNRGDVTAPHLANLKSWIAQLGADSSKLSAIDAEDTQDEGGAFRIDTAGLKSRYDEAKAKEAAIRAFEAPTIQTPTAGSLILGDAFQQVDVPNVGKPMTEAEHKALFDEENEKRKQEFPGINGLFRDF